MTQNSYYLILSILFISHVAKAQENLPEISFESNSINKAHPFYDVFNKKNTNYINWLYFHCKGLKNKNTIKTPEKKPLLFSLIKEGHVVEETIPNCVHPKLYEDEREPEWQSEIPLYSSFPSNINFHLSNDPKNGATIDLLLKMESSHVNMYMLTEDGDAVDTIIDKSLQQGNHKFYWATTDIKAGNYLLFTEIDEHLTIHSLAVEKSWWANLFSRDKEVPPTKKSIQFSFEGDIQMPEREGHCIHINRNGTSFGVSLLAAARVNIKLFSIKGDYISTLNNKQLNIGESQFLLNKHIEKTGWYLIPFSINNKKKHIKLKIKK